MGYPLPLTRALAYSLTRIQFGAPLIEKEGYTFKLLVPHFVDLEAGRAYVEEKSGATERVLEGLEPGGIAVLRAIFSVLGIDTMRVASGALREGLLHDLVGRMHHEDVREQSVQALATRCGMATIGNRRRSDPRWSIPRPWRPA